MSKIILMLTLWTGGPSIPVHTLEVTPEGFKITGILTYDTLVVSEKDFDMLTERYQIVYPHIEPLPPLGDK